MVLTTGASVTGVRALIEAHLGVETIAEPMGDKWAIRFATEGHDDLRIDFLDFLRPDVLPPRE